MKVNDALINPAREEARRLLEETSRRLLALQREEYFTEDTALEVQAEVAAACDSISKASQLLFPPKIRKQPPEQPVRSAPTHQQGQFLAFIQAYLQHNSRGVAPSHAELQRFFQLTPPSVNSMLIRLEERGFIRRIPGKARAIELTISPDLIPNLDRAFKF